MRCVSVFGDASRQIYVSLIGHQPSAGTENFNILKEAGLAVRLRIGQPLTDDPKDGRQPMRASNVNRLVDMDTPHATRSSIANLRFFVLATKCTAYTLAACAVAIGKQQLPLLGHFNDRGLDGIAFLP